MRDLDDVMRAALDADEKRIREQIDMDAVLQGTTGRVVRRRRARVIATTAAVMGVVALGTGVAWGAMHLKGASVPPAVTVTPTPTMTPSGPPTPSASSTAPSPTATLASVDVDTLGTLPQADAGVLARATTGWALLEYRGPSRSDNDETLKADRLVLADPVDGVLYHVLDLEQGDLADDGLWQVAWNPGDTTATVLAGGSTAAGSAIVVDKIDLLTGTLKVERSLQVGTSTIPVGLRHDGAILAVSNDSATGPLLAGTGGAAKTLASIQLDAYYRMDPTGHRLLALGDDRTSYQLVDLDTGDVTEGTLGSGRTCRVLGWVDGTHVAAACSTSVTTYPNGYDGPTDADGAVLLQVDVTTGTVSTVATPVAGDPWPASLSFVGSGTAVAAGWPLPSAGEVATWDQGDGNGSAEHYCFSHVYAGSWSKDSFTEFKVAGSWPLQVLGGSAGFAYIETQAGGCEGIGTVGPLEVYDAATRTTRTLVTPTGVGDEGGWTLLTAS